MTQRGLLTLTVFLLSSVCAVSVASAQENLDTQIVIDRSVLQDLKGYEPPAMFGASAKSKPVATPLARTVTPPPQATLTVPKADALLDFPVKNENVVTRQRMTAPDEAIAHARPDYSDSHTVLHMTPVAAAPKKETGKPAKAKKSAKAPLPPKKPSIQLASVTTDEIKAITAVKPSMVKKAAAASDETVIIKAQKLPVVAPSVLADAPVMIPATPVAKYVPKNKPSMPAVPSGVVEKAHLDAFALPLTDKDAKDAPAPAKPTPGERMMDQALTSKMATVDKADIESAVGGGKVAAGRKDEPLIMASLPQNATGSARIETMTMEFKPKLTDLQVDQQNTLKSNILSYLKKNDTSRLQIVSFASQSGSASDARRLSLSRALAVRSYLMDNGIEPSRMDVRAMGNNTTEQPADRVDLIFIR